MKGINTPKWAQSKDFYLKVLQLFSKYQQLSKRDLKQIISKKLKLFKKDPEYSDWKDSDFPKVNDLLTIDVSKQIFKTPVKSGLVTHITPYPGYFMIDLFFIKYVQSNGRESQLKYLLLVNVPSRKAWVRQISDRKGNSIINAFDDILSTFNKTDLIMTILADKEFSRGYFANYVKDKYDIKIIEKDPTEHYIMGILDRLVRHIRKYYKRKKVGNKMFKGMKNNERNSLMAMEEVIEEYNQRPHSSLFYLTPNEVWSDTNLQNKIYEYYHELNQDKLKDINEKVNINKGDTVRVYERNSNPFSKERNYSLSTHKVKKKNKYSYNVEGYKDTRFKAYELQKVNPYSMSFKDNFLRDKPVKRKRTYEEEYNDEYTPRKR